MQIIKYLYNTHLEHIFAYFDHIQFDLLASSNTNQ